MDRNPIFVTILPGTAPKTPKVHLITNVPPFLRRRKFAKSPHRSSLSARSASGLPRRQALPSLASRLPSLSPRAKGATRHQSPVTSHQSPVTSHQSPVTSHQSPVKKIFLLAHRSHRGTQRRSDSLPVNTKSQVRPVAKSPFTLPRRQAQTRHSSRVTAPKALPPPAPKAPIAPSQVRPVALHSPAPKAQLVTRHLSLVTARSASPHQRRILTPIQVEPQQFLINVIFKR